MNRPNIFNYDSHRRFLKDWYDWMKKSHDGFSFRTFSMWAGFSSPNQLQLIINGKRNITKDTLSIFLKLLKLNRKEQKYFELLVDFNQTSNPESKARYLLQIANHTKRYGDRLQHEQYEYLTKWYYPVIREMVALADFKEDGRSIANSLGHRITPRQADEAIEKLISLGLLERDAKGKLGQRHTIVTTGNETAEAAAYFYHEQMLTAAQDALHRQSPKERNMSGITFACNKSDLPELVQMINDLRKKVLAFLDGKAGSAQKNDAVYQLEVQLFGITSKRRNI